MNFLCFWYFVYIFPWCDDPEGRLGVNVADYPKYIEPNVDSSGHIIVDKTPKDYAGEIGDGEHMISVGIPDGYYSRAVGKSDEELKSTLSEILEDNSKVFTYSQVWDMLYAADVNPLNDKEVWLLYVEYGVHRDHYYKGTLWWNREHIYAKSHGDFGTRNGPGTDGHHLRASNPRENSIRSNLNFCNVNGERTKDSGCYEPPKSSKGDVSRSCFYMAVRWGGPPHYLKLDDGTGVNKEPRIGVLSDMLDWNNLDPVDPFEIYRVNQIMKWQQNRNPFIDHPELADFIWGTKKGEPWDGGRNYP